MCIAVMESGIGQPLHDGCASQHEDKALLFLRKFPKALRLTAFIVPLKIVERKTKATKKLNPING